MRPKLDREKLDRFLYAIAAATAILLGWRDTTIDVDLKIDPENDQILRAISDLKEQLSINVELASPSDFIPEVPGWEARSKFIMQDREGTIYPYDFYAQALSKIGRFHERDTHDVRELLRRRLVEPDRLREWFDAIEPLLYRFPAISKKAFRNKFDVLLSERSS